MKYTRKSKKTCSKKKIRKSKKLIRGRKKIMVSFGGDDSLSPDFDNLANTIKKFYDILNKPDHDKKYDDYKYIKTLIEIYKFLNRNETFTFWNKQDRKFKNSAASIIYRTKFWILKCFNKQNNINEESNESFQEKYYDNNYYRDEVVSYLDKYEPNLLNTVSLTVVKFTPDIGQLLRNNHSKDMNKDGLPFFTIPKEESNNNKSNPLFS